MVAVKGADALAEKGADTSPARRDDGTQRGQSDANVELPGRAGEAAGQTEFEHRDRSTGPDDASELAHRRRRILDVPEQVRERQSVEGVVCEGKALRAPLDELDFFGEPGLGHAVATRVEHLPALVEAHDAAAGPAGELDGDRRRASGDVENGVVRADIHPRDEEPAPTRILAEGEEAGVAVVGRAERREQLDRVHGHRVYGGLMALKEDLEQIAEAAASFAADGEQVSAVFAAELPGGERVYLCAYGEGDAVTWLALDEGGEPITDREQVRAAASLVALSEVAVDSAGGGELDELRSRLVALRLTENPPGIDEAEEAVIALQQTLGSSPRLATADFLDEVGAATKRLEESLGEASESPFALAMKSASHAVESLTSDVETHYKKELT